MALAAVVGAYKIQVWPDDHPPPHAHVQMKGQDWRVELGTGVAGVKLLSEPRGASTSDTQTAVQLVREHREACAALWRRFHG